MGPAAYDRQLRKHSEAIEAAEAERERLAAHADALEEAGRNLDAEEETLRRLAELRSSISERVRGAEARDLDALRAAVGAVFAYVVVAPESSLYWLSASAGELGGELLARLDEPLDEDPDAGVAFERTGSGWREVEDDSLVIAPVVRAEMLRETRNVVAEPIRRIPLGIAVEEIDRNSGARPDHDEQRIKGKSDRTTHSP